MTVEFKPEHRSVTIKTVQSELESKRELVKRMYAKGCTDDELELFIMACKKTGLDPFMKQIYAIKRKDQMTIQTSIDGLRLIADRTGNYAPGKESRCDYNESGKLVCATAFVKKRTSDGTWHEVSSSVYYDEYCQKFFDPKTGQEKVAKFWQQMPHVMLSKCAEASALRRAFPAELSGIYTNDEMDQADNIDSTEADKEGIFYEDQQSDAVTKTHVALSEKQQDLLGSLADQLDDDRYIDAICKKMNIPTIYHFPRSTFTELVNDLKAKIAIKRSRKEEKSA